MATDIRHQSPVGTDDGRRAARHLTHDPFAPSGDRDLPLRGLRLTDLAGRFPVDLEPFPPRFSPGSSQLARHVVTAPEVHIIRCLPSKRRVGQTFVVLLDVEGDELPDLLDAVERVQEAPLMLQGSPPRFDHRVREADVGLSQRSFEQAGVNQLVDLPVDVLAAAIAKTSGLSSLDARDPIASSSPVTVLAVSNLADTCHARMRRE